MIQIDLAVCIEVKAIEEAIPVKIDRDINVAVLVDIGGVGGSVIIGITIHKGPHPVRRASINLLGEGPAQIIRALREGGRIVIGIEPEGVATDVVDRVATSIFPATVNRIPDDVLNLQGRAERNETGRVTGDRIISSQIDRVVTDSLGA